jgi:hypothetical protein
MIYQWYTSNNRHGRARGEGHHPLLDRQDASGHAAAKAGEALIAGGWRRVTLSARTGAGRSGLTLAERGSSPSGRAPQERAPGRRWTGGPIAMPMRAT